MFQLLKSNDIYGLYEYNPHINFGRKEKIDKNSYAIIRFKNYFTNANIFRKKILRVKEYFKCDTVIVIPSAKCKLNSLQRLFGNEIISRIKDREVRKYKHLKINPENEVKTLIINKEKVGNKKILLVDDICSTGESLNVYAGFFDKSEVIKFAIGINRKLDPVLFAEIEYDNDDWFMDFNIDLNNF